MTTSLDQQEQTHALEPSARVLPHLGSVALGRLTSAATRPPDAGAQGGGPETAAAGGCSRAESRPLFSWASIEGTVDVDGRFDTTARATLVLDINATNQLIAGIGARRFLLLFTLALHSVSDPAHDGRRVVRATIPELAALAAGGDNMGWSETTIAPVLKDLERRRLLVRLPGRRRGRGGGMDKTTFLLADGLFSPQPPIPTPPTSADDRPEPVAASEPNAGQALPPVDHLAANMAHEQDPPDPGLHEAAPAAEQTTRRDGTTPNRERGKGVPAEPMSATGPGGDTNETVAPAGTDAALRHELGVLGWSPTAIDSALAIQPADRLAAWALWARHLAGVLLKTQLDADTTSWPPGWTQTATVGLAADGTLTRTTPTAPKTRSDPCT